MIFGGQCAHPGATPAVDDVTNSVDDPIVRLFFFKQKTAYEIKSVECFAGPIAITPLRSLLETLNSFAGENFGVIRVENFGVNLSAHFQPPYAVPHPDAVPPRREQHQAAAAHALVPDLVLRDLLRGRDDVGQQPEAAVTENAKPLDQHVRTLAPTVLRGHEDVRELHLRITRKTRELALEHRLLDQLADAYAGANRRGRRRPPIGSHRVGIDEPDDVLALIRSDHLAELLIPLALAGAVALAGFALARFIGAL